MSLWLGWLSISRRDESGQLMLPHFIWSSLLLMSWRCMLLAFDSRIASWALHLLLMTLDIILKLIWGQLNLSSLWGAPPISWPGKNQSPIWVSVNSWWSNASGVLLKRLKCAQWCPTLCDPMDCSPPASSVCGISQQEYQRGLPFPPPGDLSDPGIEPMPLGSPSLASGFFTTAPPGKPRILLRVYYWCVHCLGCETSQITHSHKALVGTCGGRLLR